MTEWVVRYFWWIVIGGIVLANAIHWLCTRFRMPTRRNVILEKPYRDTRDSLDAFKKMFPRA